MNPKEFPPTGFGRELSHLVGMTTDQATEVATEEGIETIRVLELVDGMTITPMTMDWSSRRLNLYVEHGLVVNAVIG